MADKRSKNQLRKRIRELHRDVRLKECGLLRLARNAASLEKQVENLARDLEAARERNRKGLEYRSKLEKELQTYQKWQRTFEAFNGSSRHKSRGEILGVFYDLLEEKESR